MSNYFNYSIICTLPLYHAHNINVIKIQVHVIIVPQRKNLHIHCKLFLRSMKFFLPPHIMSILLLIQPANWHKKKYNFKFFNDMVKKDAAHMQNDDNTIQQIKFIV